MTPDTLTVLMCIVGIVLGYGLGARAAQWGMQSRYEEHISEHSVFHVPGCIFCGVERPHIAQLAREIIESRLARGPEQMQ